MKKNIIFIFLTFSISLFSQQTYSDLPECAKAELNQIKIPSDSSFLKQFFIKLDSLKTNKKGRINVLHIGGSHVQADMYTHVIRQRIDDWVEEQRSARGLIFPYSAAKTNNPYNYITTFGGEWKAARNSVRQFDIEQGMTGILIHTSDDSSWINIELNRDSSDRYLTNRVFLLGRSMRGNFEPVLSLANDKKVEPKINDRGFVFELDTLVSSFKIMLKQKNPFVLEQDTFVVTGIIPENDAFGVVYHTIGVNGASVPSYLNCVDFEQDLHLIKPDLAVFAIGINDAMDRHFSDSVFCANYDSLLTKIRCVNPNCAFVFITNNDSYKKIRRKRKRIYVVNRNGIVAQQSFYSLAKKWNGGVYDLFEIMGGLSSMSKWQQKGLARPDKIHFSRKGYELIGTMYSDAFLKLYHEMK
ncbi:MAG: hypothetical protein IIW13_03605 [Paludibacteraceae bacterium]|nr:hypothetical protein [Paludibacteraceae bacterium]